MGLSWVFLCGLAGCGGDAGSDAGSPDGGTPVDAATAMDDAGAAPTTRFDELTGAPEERLDIPGLEGPVDVIYDGRGIPHIYGTTTHDVLMAQGYLMAVDRWPQMEFIRRGVTGRLSEVVGLLQPDIIEQDFDARVNGFARMGRRIYESLPEDDRSRRFAEAFIEGVNLYIGKVRSREVVPADTGNDLIPFLVNPTPATFLDDWTPADIFAMARYQAFSLSFDAPDDINRSRILAAMQATFGGDTDVRRGIYADLYSPRPARPTFTRDGFNNEGTDTGSRAWDRDGQGPRPFAPMPLPNPLLLARGARYLERTSAFIERFGFGDESRGSNNWVVAGSHTASGHPIMSNDPHLSLYSPPVWWYCHLNTAAMNGGESDDPERSLDVQGVSFAGLPGVVLGFNRHVAWGATTTGYDVGDIYEEQITDDGDGPGTVRFQGRDVAITVETETFRIMGGRSMTREIEYVPHHGPILPGTRTAVDGQPGRFTGLSVRYTGFDVSNELAFFTSMAVARSVDEAEAAQDAFRVGAQNFVFADVDSIRWSSESRVPVRDARACTFEIAADGRVSGHSPLFVLPGSGEYEWTGDLDERYVPHDQDPARGFIATANQDNVGVIADGNPCNDPHYLGGDFDPGFREERITQRLVELTTRGDITMAEMSALQGDSRSSIGAHVRDTLVEILGAATTHVPTLTTAEQARVADARTRLMAWTFATPHGVGATAAGEVGDSVATTIFNAALARIIPLALGDEARAMSALRDGSTTFGNFQSVNWIDRALDPETEDDLYTWDATHMQSALWDDVSTTTTYETKAEIIVRGFVAALEYLHTTLGDDPTMWRWGRLHTVRFRTLVPAPDPSTETLSIPPQRDPMFPNGFPRHGDFGAVDPGNYSFWSGTNYTFNSGASQRLVVEMLPDGPRAVNALPGGQAFDPASPHHADEAQLWIRNEAPPIAFTETDVLAARARRVLLY